MPADPVISDQSVKSPSRLLAEALRVKLGASPVDYLLGPPAGTLEIDRAYLPIFELAKVGLTVVSLIPQDQAGEITTREFKTLRTVTVMVSVQTKIAASALDHQGKVELDAAKDYSERVLRACLQTVTDVDGNKYSPTVFDSTGHDQESLAEWNQFAEVHSIAYETIV